MNRRAFIAGLGGAAAWPMAARTQRPVKLTSVGWLTAQQATSLTPYLEAMRAGFADLGYVGARTSRSYSASVTILLSVSQNWQQSLFEFQWISLWHRAQLCL